MDTHTDDDDLLSDDYAKYLNTPRKLSPTLFDTAYQSIGQRGTIRRVIGTILINGLVTILATFIIFSSSPYYPIQYDLRYIPFSLAYLLLIFTSFLIGTVIQFLVFRATMGKGKLIAHAYLNSIGSVWSLVLSGLGILVLIITRIEIISVLITGLGGLYLIYVAYLSLKAIHHLSTTRAIAAMIISTIIMVPEILLHFYLFAFFRESRPFTIYNWQLVVSILSMLLISLFILAYMSYERELVSDYPNTIPLLDAARKIFTNKRVIFATIVWFVLSGVAISLHIIISWF